MGSIVLYESKYGSTKRYAQWIGEELSCEVKKISDIKVDDLYKYDNIIFGGWLHAGTIMGLKNLKENIEKLKEKNIIIFAVGLSVVNDEAVKEIKTKNLENMDNVKLFYIRGAFNYKNLTIGDKAKMKVFKVFLKKQDQEDENVRGMLEAYDTPVDFTDKKEIQPIVKATK